MGDLPELNPDVLKSLSKALYGTAFDNYDPAHLFVDKTMDPNEETGPTLSEKIIIGEDSRADWEKTIPFGGVLYDSIHDGAREPKRDDTNDFSEFGEHGCGTECDKDCEGAGEPERTCKDCTHQDEGKAITGSIGVTYCGSKSTYVPSDSETCDDFDEKADADPAEAMNKAHSEAADLKSQNEALKSANQELLELANNCPDCGTNLQVIDSLIEENLQRQKKLNDANKALLAERRWRVDVKHRIDRERNSQIKNLQARIQGEAKEIEILKKSLLAAESALESEVKKRRDHDATNALVIEFYSSGYSRIKELHTAKIKSLVNAEREYMFRAASVQGETFDHEKDFILTEYRRKIRV